MAGRYTWGKHLFTKYESLWSIVHKFADVNSLSHSDIYRALGDERAQKSPPRTEWSLARFHRLSSDRISYVLNINLNDLRFVTTDEYAIDFGIFDSFYYRCVSEFLRYCPVCIRHGFHTPLFQYQYVKRCPIHNESLTDRCTNCDSVNKYAMVKCAFDVPYCCEHCLVSYYKDQHGVYYHDLSDTKVAAVDDYFSWKPTFTESLQTENFAIGTLPLTYAESLLGDHRHPLLFTSIPCFKDFHSSIFCGRESLNWPDGALCVEDFIQSHILRYTQSERVDRQASKLNKELALIMCQDTMRRTREKIAANFCRDDIELDGTPSRDGVPVCSMVSGYDTWNALMGCVGQFSLYNIKTIDTFSDACGEIEFGIKSLKNYLNQSDKLNIEESIVDDVVLWVFQSLHEEYLLSSFFSVFRIINKEEKREAFMKVNDPLYFIQITTSMEEVFNAVRLILWKTSLLNVDPFTGGISLTIIGSEDQQSQFSNIECSDCKSR